MDLASYEKQWAAVVRAHRRLATSLERPTVNGTCLIFAAWGTQTPAVIWDGYGGDMAKDLNVDAGGLKSAAADSIAVAADVLANGFDGSVSARPSGVGIAAFDAASATVRTRISGRIAGQSGDVAAAGDRYDATDGGNADAIAVTM
jgi:hypothetical protein